MRLCKTLRTTRPFAVPRGPESERVEAAVDSDNENDLLYSTAGISIA